MRFTQARVNSLKPPAGKADHEEIDEAMPGFGIRFRNGGSGTYFIKYRLGGKDGRLSLGKVSKITLADAQAAAKRHFAVLADKIDPSIERARAVAKVSDTIEPLIDDFVGYLRRNGRADTYLAEVERSLRRYFSPLHRFNAADINRAMIAKSAGDDQNRSRPDRCRPQPRASVEVLHLDDCRRPCRAEPG